MTSHALIRLCGSISVELDGRPVHDRIRHGHELLLFAYLALSRGRAVSRDEASGVIWPDAAPQHENAALRTVLSRLRSAIGADLLDTARGLVLRLPSKTRIDVVEAQDAIAEARRCHDARRALDLVSPARRITEQPFLAGLEGPWIDARRRELADLWVDASEVMAWAYLEVHDYAGAEIAARGLIERAPLHESGYEPLMHALAARHNVAAALGVYEDLRVRLARDLGVPPGAALRELHHDLLVDGGSEALAQRPAALSLVELRELTRSVAATPRMWQHLVRHDPTQRAFELLFRRAKAEAWWICWMPGHDSGPHDHDISSGAITVIDGELTEERFAWGAATTRTVFRAGDTFDFGPTDIHRVWHSGRTPATAIHAFSPPLRGLGSYARGPRGEVQRRSLGPREEVKASPTSSSN